MCSLVLRSSLTPILPSKAMYPVWEREGRTEGDGGGRRRARRRGRDTMAKGGRPPRLSDEHLESHRLEDVGGEVDGGDGGGEDGRVPHHRPVGQATLKGGVVGGEVARRMTTQADHARNGNSLKNV